MLIRTYSYPGRTHGSVAVAALVGMVVTLVIVAGLMTAAMQTVLRGRQQQNSSAATYLAEAGVQYGYWQYIYNGATLPYNGAATLPGGSFTVQVVDNSANLANTIKITATGAHSTANASLVRIYNNANSQSGNHSDH